MMPILKQIEKAIYTIIKNSGDTGISVEENPLSYSSVQSVVQNCSPSLFEYKQVELVDTALENLLAERKVCAKFKPEAKTYYYFADGQLSYEIIQEYFD